jgi:cyclohexyl-isocyanide hydratase
MTSTNALPDSPPPLQIGMLIYPGMTLLDLSGPQNVFSPHGQTHLLWKNLQPVLTDSGISVLPTITFADCPKELDVLFAPGGYGTFDVLEDAETLAFMRDRGRTAKYVTSVCSGSLILAAAGPPIGPPAAFSKRLASSTCAAG